MQELVNLKVVCAYLFRKGRCLKLFIDPIVGVHSFRHGWLTGPARHPEFVCLRHSKMLQTRGKTCDWSVPGRSTMLQVMGICDLGEFRTHSKCCRRFKNLETRVTFCVAVGLGDLSFVNVGALPGYVVHDVMHMRAAALREALGEPPRVWPGSN